MFDLHVNFVVNHQRYIVEIFHSHLICTATRSHWQRGIICMLARFSRLCKAFLKKSLNFFTCGRLRLGIFVHRTHDSVEVES